MYNWTTLRHENLKELQMKKLLLLVGVILFCLSGFAQDLSFTSPIPVSDANNFKRPRIALVDDHKPVVLFGGDASKPLYVSRFNGISFDAPVQITPPNLDPAYAYWMGAEIAAKGQDVWVIFKAEPEHQHPVYLVHSADGGITWSDTIKVVGNQPLTRMPEMDLLADGTPIVCYMRYDSTNTYPYYYTKQWVTNAWTKPMRLDSLLQDEACDCCPAEILPNADKPMVVYRNNDHNLREVKLAIQEGSSGYNKIINVDNTAWTLNTCPSSGPDIVRFKDSLVTIWHGRPTGPANLYISTIDTTNYAMGYHGSFVDTSAVQNYPRLSASDEFIASVHDMRIGSKFRTVVNYSSNSITEFRNQVIKIDSGSAHQRYPDVIVGGKVAHMVYEDYGTGKIMYRAFAEEGLSLPEKLNLELNIYPNPSAELIYIQSELDFDQAHIYDLQGKLVSQQLVNEGRIDISSLASGQYILSVEFNQSVYQARFNKL